MIEVVCIFHDIHISSVHNMIGQDCQGKSKLKRWEFRTKFGIIAQKVGYICENHSVLVQAKEAFLEVEEEIRKSIQDFLTRKAEVKIYVDPKMEEARQNELRTSSAQIINYNDR